MRRFNTIVTSKVFLRSTAIFLAVVVFGVAILFWHLRGKGLDTSAATPSTYDVVYSAEGFTPSVLRIRVGDTVRFINRSERSFWPASDLHPAHDLYPEFDPKIEILPGQEWIFVFLKDGSWKYHDHLFPTERGEVDVSGAPSVSKEPAPTCVEESAACWERQMTDVARDQSLTAALDLVAHLYETNPPFASNCHNYVHKVGEVAYERFSRGESFEINPKASYCGYGFYHGFMESLLHESGDVAEARKLCEGAVEMVKGGAAAQIEPACYHGFGHGAVDDTVLQNANSAAAVVTPGIALCRQVADTDTRLYLCVSGVFNSLAIAWNAGSYPKITVNESYPYELCDSFPEGYVKKACFHQLNTVVAKLAKNDLQSAVRLVEKIKDKEYTLLAMDGVASQFGATLRGKIDARAVVGVCMKAQQQLRPGCVSGFASGLMEGGKPDEEYEATARFCVTPGMGNSEQDACFTTLVSSLYSWYTKDKANQLCIRVPEKYKTLCRN